MPSFNGLDGVTSPYNEEQSCNFSCQSDIYCHVPARWGLHPTTRAPDSDKTRGQGSFGPFTGGRNLTPTGDYPKPRLSHRSLQKGFGVSCRVPAQKSWKIEPFPYTGQVRLLPVLWLCDKMLLWDGIQAATILALCLETTCSFKIKCCRHTLTLHVHFIISSFPL